VVAVGYRVPHAATFPRLAFGVSPSWNQRAFGCWLTSCKAAIPDYIFSSRIFRSDILSTLILAVLGTQQ
jgi:hypothetical protein